MSTLVYTGTLTIITCGECRIPFAVPDEMYAARIADGRWFWCPNGHEIHYGEDENQKLKRELKRAKDSLAAERARADGAEASLRTTRGHVTRLRKRVLDGQCPICGQHLRDVERHVRRQHPGEEA